MPEMRTYIVTQTREVEVAANHVADAILIGTAAFESGQNSDNGVRDGSSLPEGMWGNTTTQVRAVFTQATEKGK